MIIEHLTPQAGGDDLERVARAIERAIPPGPFDFHTVAQAAIAAHRPDTRVVECLRSIVAQADFEWQAEDWERRSRDWNEALRAARTLLSELEGK